ncbi:enoyl-CoA hydratase/isomerase family protein [Arthrobacter sp. NPDC080031]|uniref:enoyl-CoA hydratase/isomerase family protein n=1 Tax=Arthrobacter sp. NPDC080031 TaxID=3155918 RepID=UPI00344D69D6
MREVLYEQHGPVLLLTINREQAHNALNASVIQGIGDGVKSAAADPGIQAVVITGTGHKAFCAGADLKELDDISADDAHRNLNVGQEAFRAIETSGIPVITAVNGLALGGGFELVLASTFPVLSTRASLGLPEASLGLIPGYGGTQRLPRAIGAATAAHLMLTGARLSANRAYELGLTPVEPVDPESLLTEAMACAERIAAQGPRAVQFILECLNASRDTPLGTGLRLETRLAATAAGGSESTEGIRAFFEKRSPDFLQAAEPKIDGEK